MGRKAIFGDYDTETSGAWTLSRWELSPPVYKALFVSVPGRDGDLDLSTALSDNEPTYESRTLNVTLERSDGTRATREAAIQAFINGYNGQRLNITGPDDSTHHLIGRLSIAKSYSDLAHCAVTVQAVCDPWWYKNTATESTYTASTTEKTATLQNGGRRRLVPTVIVSGTNASITLKKGETSQTLSAGTYKLPWLTLQTGNTSLTYKGSGTLKFTYTEAIL